MGLGTERTTLFGIRWATHRIEDEAKYNRNAFIFNLCFVFERDAELSGFEPIVRKTARILQGMEVRPHTHDPCKTT